MNSALLLLWLLSAVPPSTAPPQTSGTLNVNDATADQLDELPGIGRTLAQRILEARAHRAFHSVHELTRVKGFGEKRLRTLRALLSVSGASTFQLKKAAATGGSAKKEGGDITSAQPAKETNTEPTADGPRALDNSPLEKEEDNLQTRSSKRRGPLRRHRVSGARSQLNGFSSDSLWQGAAPSLAPGKDAGGVRLRRHAGAHLPAHH